MTLDRFKQVVDMIKRHTYTLDLSNWGDPLISPDITEMIRYAHQAGLWTYVSSNLHSLDTEGDHVEKLVGSGLDMLNCSIHGVTQETFGAYQSGKRLDTVLEKVRAIIDAKVRLRLRTPMVRLFMVVTKKNEHQTEQFAEMARGMGCEAVFTTASLNLRFVGKDKDLTDLGWSEQRKREAAAQIAAEWLPDNKEWVAPWYREGGNARRTWWSRSKKKHGCDWPWRRAVINWDGSVVPCCGVFDPQYQMGNVFEATFERIWNDENFRLARASFIRQVDKPGGEPCRSCSGVLE